MTHHDCANTNLGDLTDGAARHAVFAEFVRSGLQELMDAELAAALGADRYERTDTRTNYRNGTRPKTVATVSGDVEVAIPKLRSGSFFPALLVQVAVTALSEAAADAAIQGACRVLGLSTVRTETGRIAEAAARECLSHKAFLSEVLLAECDVRDTRRRIRRANEAKFPRSKRLADFGPAILPDLPPATLAHLASGAWIDAGQPLVLLGDSGTGKTHLLIALGTAAAEQGRRVRYVTTAALVNELVEAAADKQLSRVVGQYARLDLLCLDEIGCVRLDTPAAPSCSSRSSPPGKNEHPLRVPPTPRSRSGAPPPPTPGWPRPSSTGSPSSRTSSRPAPRPTGSEQPDGHRREPPRPDPSVHRRRRTRARP
jgi:DNA replication protein DnaC